VWANIGNHSVFLASHFAKVIAIEPNPNAALLMEANLAANDLRNVELYHVGFSECTGSLPFGETALIVVAAGLWVQTSH
jgi:FkbM family methyltransferase